MADVTLTISAEDLGALRTVERLTQSVQKLAGSSIDPRFIQQARQAAAELQHGAQGGNAFADAISHATKRVGTFLIAFESFRLVTGVFDAIGEGVIGFNAKLEQSSVSWRILLNDERNAMAMMRNLQELAIESPFRRWELDTIARQLMAMGVSSGNVIPLLKDIGNITSAYAGGSTDAFQRIAKGLTDMAAAGRVNAQDMRQLTNAGVGAWKILADAMGVTEAQARKLSEEGKISADVFIKAFAELSRTKFGDLMREQSDTLLGSLQGIQDAFLDITSTVGRPIFDRVAASVRQLRDTIADPAFRTWAADMQATTEIIMLAFDALGRTVAVVFGTMLNTVVTIGRAIYAAMQLINPFARHSEPLTDQVQRGVDLIVAKFGDLHSVVGVLQSVGAVMVNFAGAASDAFSRVQTHDLERKMADIAKIAGPGAAAAFRDISESIRELQPQIKRLNADIDEQEAVVRALQQAGAGVARQIREHERAIRDLDVANRDLIVGQRELEVRLASTRAALHAMRASWLEHKFAVEEARFAVADARDVVDTYRHKLEGLRTDLGLVSEQLSVAKQRLSTLISGDLLKGTDDERTKLQQLRDAAEDLQLALSLKRAAGVDSKALEPLQRRLERTNAQAAQLENTMKRRLRPTIAEVDKILRPSGNMTIEQLGRDAIAAAKEIKRLTDRETDLTRQIRATQSAAVDPERELRNRQEIVRLREREYDVAQRGAQGLLQQESQIEGQIARVREQLIPYVEARERERDIIKDLQDLRSGYTDSLDIEQEGLRSLKDLYSDVTSNVRDWQQALNELATLSSRMVNEQEAAARKAGKNAEMGSDLLRSGAADFSQTLAKIDADIERYNMRLEELTTKTKPLFDVLNKLPEWAERASPVISVLTGIAGAMVGWRIFGVVTGLVGKFVAGMTPLGRGKSVV